MRADCWQWCEIVLAPRTMLPWWSWINVPWLCNASRRQRCGSKLCFFTTRRPRITERAHKAICPRLLFLIIRRAHESIIISKYMSGCGLVEAGARNTNYDEEEKKRRRQSQVALARNMREGGVGASLIFKLVSRLASDSVLFLTKYRLFSATLQCFMPDTNWWIRLHWRFVMCSVVPRATRPRFPFFVYPSYHLSNNHNMGIRPYAYMIIAQLSYFDNVMSRKRIWNNFQAKHGKLGGKCNHAHISHYLRYTIYHRSRNFVWLHGRFLLVIKIIKKRRNFIHICT